MANDEHVAILKKGVDAWNAWRDENPDIRYPDLYEAESFLASVPLRSANLAGANLMRAKLQDADLSGADLSEADLSEIWAKDLNLSRAKLRRANLRHADLTWADLSGADLSGSDLYNAKLSEANLRGANLNRAKLNMAYLWKADLNGADLREASLRGTNLDHANLSGANLAGTNLMAAALVDTDLTGADLNGSHIYGVSAWSLKLDGAKQQNLVITHPDEPTVTVDNIEVAQFVYLLLHNQKIRDVIDTIGKKGVLLLGRFTEGRMEVLERVREKVRDLGYVPMVFNFDKPETKDFSETVRLLCSLSKFVIVDITNPRSAPLELQATVPDYMVPFVPILQQGEDPFAMFVDLQNKYDWVLQPVVGYPTVDRLIEVLEDEIVRPAEAKFDELLLRRTEKLRVKKV